MSEVSRRGLIAGSMAAPALTLAVAAQSQPAACPDPAAEARAALKGATGTKLVILGSGGGPAPGRSRHMTSHVMLTGGAAYVLDCGMGVTDQFARTGIGFDAVKGIFITHHHPDHNIEYGPFLVIGWTRKLPLSVRAYGPPPLRQMTTDFLRAYRTTIDFWAEDFEIAPLEDIAVEEISAAGPVMQDDKVRVRAAVVNHPPVTPALGYRFDFRDRSIAFSGDTTPVEAVAELAKGADVLVHEAIMMDQMEAFERTISGDPRTLAIGMRHMRADHSPVEDVGRIAAEAGVKTLVLSHLAPMLDSITDEDWRARAARAFKGEIIVADDMTVV